MAFLRCVLKDKLPGCLLSQERAKVGMRVLGGGGGSVTIQYLNPKTPSQALCDLMKSASPLSTLALRLQEMADEPRALLKQLLSMFGQVCLCVAMAATIRITSLFFFFFFFFPFSVGVGVL